MSAGNFEIKLTKNKINFMGLQPTEMNTVGISLD